MIIHRTVSSCDWNHISYFEPQEGVAYIARGASGRYCEVLWGGPEHKAELEARGAKILTEEEAYDEIRKLGNGWPDF